MKFVYLGKVSPTNLATRFLSGSKETVIPSEFSWLVHEIPRINQEEESYRYVN